MVACLYFHFMASGVKMNVLKVYKTEKHGDVIIRDMTEDDVPIVQKWWNDIDIISKFDLDIALKVFPKDNRGCYTAENNWKMVTLRLLISV